MRTTKKAMLEGVEGVKVAKLVKQNTLRIEYASGDVAIRLHGTDIIKTKANGDTVLNSGGWRTLTTKARINEFSRFVVVQEKYNWYVQVGGYTGQLIPFYDGITFDRNDVLTR